MRKTACVTGVLAASAGLLIAGSPAIADSADNDGINIGNDNNISVAPVQACGNDIAVLGLVAPQQSPEETHCVNAPIVDHPTGKPEKPEKPSCDKPSCDKPDCDKPDHHKPDCDKPDHHKPEKPGHWHPEKPGHGHPEKPGHGHPAPVGEAPVGEAPVEEAPAEELPTAPAPEAVAGHHAVTG